jgi:hypothetical protein
MNKIQKNKKNRIQTGGDKPIKSSKQKPKSNMQKTRHEKRRRLVWLLIDIIIISLLALVCWLNSADLLPLLAGIASSLWNVKTAILELIFSIITATMHRSSQIDPSRTTARLLD